MIVGIPEVTIQVSKNFIDGQTNQSRWNHSDVMGAAMNYRFTNENIHESHRIMPQASLDRSTLAIPVNIQTEWTVSQLAASSTSENLFKLKNIRSD